MTSIVTKFIAKKVLGETLQNQFGKEDPYFEQVPATRLDGRPTGKVKKRKKALPPGISEADGKVLTKAKRRAYRLDMALFSFLGVRFGWGSAIGIIPAVGDVLDLFMALMVYKTCCKIEGGLPMGVKIQMMVNIIIDFVIGIIPFLGDLMDALFRANTRNVILLEEHLRDKGKKELRKSGLPVPDVDPSSPIEYDKYKDEDFGTIDQHAATQPTDSRKTKPSGKKSRPVDEEMAYGDSGVTPAQDLKKSKKGRK